MLGGVTRGTRLVAVPFLVVALLGGGAASAASPGDRSTDVDVVRVALAKAVPRDAAGVGDVVEGRLLVRVRDDADADAVARLFDRLDAGPRASTGSRVHVLDGLSDAVVVASGLATSSLVQAVAVDRVVDFRPASDPLVPQQWGLRNTGQRVAGRAGVPGIDVGAIDAWRATKGRRQVTVAIIDTGLDTSHPDLAPNLWANPAERNGIPGIDDDGNGYVDDDHGWNFATGSPQVYHSPEQDAHGTHVAGIVAAALDDGGTAGVAPGVRVMPLKFLTEDGVGSIGDAIEAVRYAADNGADVINASWGVRVRAFEAPPEGLTLLETAIADARIPFVAAAGNFGVDLESWRVYPASFDAPNIIAVAAVDNRGRLASFSGYSSAVVDLAAPGVGVLSTLPERSYGWMEGTSQAAPHVTGIVALAISLSGDTNGSRMARNVRRTTRPFGPLDDVRWPSGATVAGLASGPGLLSRLGADLGACPGGAPRADLSDVARGNVHARSIDCVVHRGLARGFPDGTYRPHQAVTRAQVATFLAGLYRTAADLEVPKKGQFRDVSGSNVHRDNIEALAAVGIIGGFPDGRFRPSRPVTREQFASLLVRTYQHLARGEVRGRARAFPDGGSGTHRDSVRLAAYLEFVQGRTDGTFGPFDDVTRAQLSSLIRRSHDKLVDDRVSAGG